MASSSLGRRLVAEFRRGGKKTLLLALLLAGGLCIWLPMIWKRVSAGPPGAEPVLEASTPPLRSATTAVTTAAPTTPTVPATPADWKSLQARNEASPLLKPETIDDLVRDPFDRQWIREWMASLVGKSDAPETAKPDPARELVCSSIVIGSTARAAIINGVIYRIGDRVPRKGPAQFVVKDILPDQVVLERDGQDVNLAIQRGQEL